jgi:hypothetical protein
MDRTNTDARRPLRGVPDAHEHARRCGLRSERGREHVVRDVRVQKHQRERHATTRDDFASRGDCSTGIDPEFANRRLVLFVA